MVVIESKFDSYHINDKLKSELDGALKLNKKDNDCVIIVDGREGSGKSVLALQMAHYVDPNFSVDNIVFSIKDFKHKIRTLKKYSALVFDEAFRGFSSRSVLSSDNKQLVKLLMECRQQRLFIFLILPSFFELETYASIHRAQYLFHVYMRKHQRGFFVGFGYKQKERLFYLGKKIRSYARPRTGFRGTFGNHYPINEDAYRQKKNESFTKNVTVDEELSPNDIKRFAVGEILSKLKESGNFKQKELAQMANLSPAQVRHRLDFYRKNREEEDEPPPKGFYDGPKEFRMPPPS